MADIEIGTSRSLATAGADLVRAAIETAQQGTTSYVTVDGRRVVVIMTLDPATQKGQATCVANGQDGS